MADDTSSSSFDHDFDAIQAAVLETARGRWFLAEFARRNRVAETDKLLGAIQRLERTGDDREEGAPQSPTPALTVPPANTLLADLKSLLEGVATANAAVRAIEPSDLGHLVAPDAKGFDRVVDSPADAHATILAAAEQIQETVWMLREQGAAPRLCDELDRRATQVFAACAYGELTARRTAALATAFAALVEQASTMAQRHRVGVALAPAPARQSSRTKRPVEVPPPVKPPEPRAVPQAALAFRDATRRSSGVVAHLPDTAPPLAATDRPRRPTTLADIDALTAREKLRLFT